jgi:ankyrin repeat protein
VSASLPSRPDLDWLKNRAKERLADLRASDPAAKLADAQRDVARRYGFPSWRALKAHVDSVRAETAAPAADDTVRAFFAAVGTGQIDRVRAALDHAPSFVHAVGPHPFWGGRPQALHVSIESDRREAFDLLLARGANVDGVNAGYMGWSPLLLAVHWKRAEMRQALLARGARVGLAEALALGDDAAVDALLAAHGLPAATPNDGTWLHFARTTHAIDRLLALGAAVDRKDFWGASPVEALSRMGPAGASLVAHLVARGAKAGAAELARMNDRAALERLAPDERIAPGAFKAAVDFGHHDLVRWLLAQGADVDGRGTGPAAETPLHSAAWNGDLAMARLLVEAGADLNARDRQYDGAPLGWAETALEVTNNSACADVAAFLKERAG